MRKSVTSRIALRYLRAKKSHSAVTAISVVSVIGIAVATAAIVCVLSVFNGFKDILSEKLDTLAPDIALTPAAGKTFSDADSLLGVVKKIPGVETASPVVADNALIIANGREMPIMLKGVVRDDYRRLTAIDSILLDGARLKTSDDSAEAVRYVYDDDIGDFVEEAAEKKYFAAIAIGISSRSGNLMPGEKLLVFAPRRQGRVNMANPAASFMRDSVEVSGIFCARQSDYDDNYMITDIDLARDLFQYHTEATSIEIKVRPGSDASAVARNIGRQLDERYVVKDRLQQQEMNFRMISIEKWVTFLLLAFILIVASFNVISTLSMLVLEKQESLHTLRALGMSSRRIGRIFAWESFYVTLIGTLAGIALGVGLCLLQQHFGFIRLNGNEANLVIKAYPVSVQGADIAVVMVPVLIIGVATALISARFARSRIRAAKTQ